MTRRDLPALDPLVLSLLASEKTPVIQPDDVKARAFARAAVTTARTVRSLPHLRKPWMGLRARIASAVAGGVVAIAAVGSAAFHVWRSGAPAPVGPDAPASSTFPPAGQSPAIRARGQSPQQPSVKPIDAEQVARELHLLAAARIAVTRGNFAEALAIVAEHGRLFPTGPLAEEREALRVRSLLGLGRDADARRAAAAFQVRFPRSVFLSRMIEVSQKGGH